MGYCKQFYFSVKEDGVYLSLIPTQEANNSISINDLIIYIQNSKIPECDFITVNSMFQELDNCAITKKISASSMLPLSETADYSISSDNMMVEACFYPPFEGQKLMNEQDIINNIENLGVKAGIDHEMIRQFLNERIYCKKYVVCRGVPAKEGKEGYIEYKFNTDLKPVPKVKDDGTVDFHSLDNINRVSEGDVVAVLHPENRGECGYDIFNRVLRPLSVKHVIFRHGNNLIISEDGLSLITKVSGHVTLEGDKIFVSNVMELVDVDNSTGNIEYNGSVNIKGNVLAGFKVHASGDINVSGVVEGAEIIAGQDIVISRGIQGMNKAYIKAGGNIVSKFIESAKKVEAGGKIETDSILHSNVIARNNIKVTGKNGLIVGGEVKSTTMIEAKSIGNEMGTNTIIGVGVDPEIRLRVDELKKSLDELGNNKIQMSQILLALKKKEELVGKLEPEKLELRQKVTRKLVELEYELNKDKNELEQIKVQLVEDKNAKIKVTKSIYVGVKIMFGEQFMFLREKMDYCQFVKEKFEIKCQTL